MDNYDREAVKRIKDAIWEYHDDLDLCDEVSSLVEALHEMIADFMIEMEAEGDE